LTRQNIMFAENEREYMRLHATSPSHERHIHTNSPRFSFNKGVLVFLGSLQFFCTYTHTYTRTSDPEAHRGRCPSQKWLVYFCTAHYVENAAVFHVTSRGLSTLTFWSANSLSFCNLRVFIKDSQHLSTLTFFCLDRSLHGFPCNERSRQKKKSKQTSTEVNTLQCKSAATYRKK